MEDWNPLMHCRRVIRVLTVNNKTIHFFDKGVLRGTAVEYVRLFEDELNKKLAAEKKLKNKNLKVRGLPPARATSPPPVSRSRRSAGHWWTSPQPA